MAALATVQYFQAWHTFIEKGINYCLSLPRGNINYQGSALGSGWNQNKEPAPTVYNFYLIHLERLGFRIH